MRSSSHHEEDKIAKIHGRPSYPRHACETHLAVSHQDTHNTMSAFMMSANAAITLGRAHMRGAKVGRSTRGAMSPMGRKHTVDPSPRPSRAASRPRRRSRSRCPRSDGTVRVRFAPSPTGNLHVGGARTALFNWLYARRTWAGSSSCAWRTPISARSTRESEDAMVRDLKWLGLDWDEGSGQRRAVRPVPPVRAAGAIYKQLAHAARGGGTTRTRASARTRS